MSFAERLLIFFEMIVCHAIADFNLQGILASMKQRSWWREQFKENFRLDKMYRNDYKAALLVHSFVWSFIIEIPLMCHVYDWNEPNQTLLWIIMAMYVVNTFIHYKVDDAKANRHMMSLCSDQLCHVFQILITWILGMAAI